MWEMRTGSLEKMAQSYHHSALETTRKLDVELQELEDWNCCGATAYFHVDELLAYTLTARNLAMAEKDGLDLVDVDHRDGRRQLAVDHDVLAVGRGVAAVRAVGDRHVARVARALATVQHLGTPGDPLPSCVRDRLVQSDRMTPADLAASLPHHFLSAPCSAAVSV